MLTRRSAISSLALLGCGVLLAGCNDKGVASSVPLERPEVSFVTVEPSPRAIVKELPGRIAPLRVADVRPRVGGIIVARLFEQGSEVKAGDALYQIDPKPFEVELQAAEAALAKADAILHQATLHAARIDTLTKSNAASQATNEAAIASLAQAKADRAAREADVARARLNLGYATIRAPISGVIGAALMSEGALVTQNETQPLATIQQLNSVYADFTQSVLEMNRLRRDFERGDLDRVSDDAAKVHLVLDDGTVYPVDGRLLFSDAKVDANTGQVTLRGEFKNPGRDLLPGMFVRVLIEQARDPDAIVVPPQAIQRNLSGAAEVYLVKDDNRVAAQPVRTGALVDGQWMVTEGLHQGQRVVVEGFQKFAVGDVVKPSVWKGTEVTDATSGLGNTPGDSATRQSQVR